MQIGNDSASFTRPNDTTAYASGDLVANSTTAASVVPMSLSLTNGFAGGQTRITRVRLSKTSVVPTNANFRVHFYTALPTIANGDNAAWSTSGAANYVGPIDVTSMLAFTDGCNGVGAATAGSELLLRFSGGTLFALLEAKAAYTPTAQEVFTLTIEELSAF
jgi:hypothetical protein